MRNEIHAGQHEQIVPSILHKPPQTGAQAALPALTNRS